MASKVRDVALNKWPGILLSLGVLNQSDLARAKTACPVCGGKDRFRFDNKDGRGTWFCNQCDPRAGDGLDLVMRVKGWNFKTAAQEVEKLAGVVQQQISTTLRNDREILEFCKILWSQTRPVSQGDPVYQYLKRRVDIDAFPSSIRFHPSLAYRHENGTKTFHPAMISKIQCGSGGVGLHRTYLTEDGFKAALPQSKKVIGTMPAGCAVRLSEPKECLGIAEGIETALSASKLFALPVWSAISSTVLEKWMPPEEIKKVVIFADNDPNGAGLKSAAILQGRLYQLGLQVETKLPSDFGDWNDVFIASKSCDAH